MSQVLKNIALIFKRSKFEIMQKYVLLNVLGTFVNSNINKIKC